MFSSHLASAACVVLTGLLFCGSVNAAGSLSHGRFKDVEVYRPAGEVKNVVLFLSGESGWTPHLAAAATTLAADGAMVIGIDTRHLVKSLESDGASCVFPDGDLENLSHYVQAYYKLPTYFTPLLAGYSSGATIAYAVIAQAPPGIFSGALSLAFCADLDLRKPLCNGEALHYSRRKDGTGMRLGSVSKLHAPWVAVHGGADTVCPAAQARELAARTAGARFMEVPGVGHDFDLSSAWLPQFEAAYASIARESSQSVPLPPASLSDLPVIEVPAAGTSDTFAVLLSGDGGWAGLDKEVAAQFASRGIPVAGIDSLRYFWHARTPEGLSRDIDRTLRYYASRWQKQRALLIGYSQGADVLPFAMNRLPPATRSLVTLTTLIGIGQKASFEFHVSSWLGSEGDGLPVQPETDKLSARDTLCLYGSDDDESFCPAIGGEHAVVMQLRGGHHFDGDYQQIAQLILERAGLAGNIKEPRKDRTWNLRRP